MGYLNLAKGIPGFNKAIISLWFRVPSESLNKLRDRGREEPSEPPARLQRVLPLMTFGKLYEGYRVEQVISGSASYTVTHMINDIITGSDVFTYSTGATYREAGHLLIDPSYIGIRYDFDDEQNAPMFSLAVNLQTANTGSPQYIHTNPSNSISSYTTGYYTGDHSGGTFESHYSGSWGTCVTLNIVPNGHYFERVTQIDDSVFYEEGAGPDSVQAGFEIKVEPDKWHHALISFDLSPVTSADGGFGTSSFDGCDPSKDTIVSNTDHSFNFASQVWIALDDKNYTGYNIHGLRPETDAGAELGEANNVLSRTSRNAWLSQNGNYSSVAHGVTGTVSHQEFTSQRASYTFTAGNLPSEEEAFGLPAADNMEDMIIEVDMAEFQMWLGQTMDTGDQQNRRLFVDFNRDEKGNVIVDEDGKSVMGPVRPSVAEEKLGRPELLLHTTSKWKKGENTGSLGLERREDEPDQIIDSGQFTVTGRVEKYTPDPSL
jgi:hypothetical protein